MDGGAPKSLLDCIDEKGDIDQEAFTKYVQSQPRVSFIRKHYTFDESEPEPPRKPKIPRQTYEREDPKTSNWYRYYISRPVTSKKALKSFRRAFRLPYRAYVAFVRDARDGKWFPKSEHKDALGRVGTPLELLVLGALRYLGRGWTFHDIAESTGVSEEVHRNFFYDFVKVRF